MQTEDSGVGTPHIELRPTGKPGVQQVIIDGEIVLGTQVLFSDEAGHGGYFQVSSAPIPDMVLSLPLTALKTLGVVNGGILTEWERDLQVFGSFHIDGGWELRSAWLMPHAGEWRRSYSFRSLAKLILETATGEGTSLDWRYEELMGPIVSADSLSRQLPISATIGDVIELAKEFFKDYLTVARTKIAETPDALVELFRFPSSVESTAVQYLSYFVQFLRDLGIEADSVVERRAGEVLFSVTPIEGMEALARVREALTIYLQLPTAPVVPTEGADVAVTQLQGVIMQYQSQVLMLKAAVQQQSAALEYKDATIDLLSRGSSVGEAFREKDHGEEILDGLATIVPYETKGLRINFPEVWRRLKRRFD